MNIKQENLFSFLEEVGLDEIDIDNYNFLPTVRYCRQISTLCADLKSISNIHTFCPTIALSNGDIFYTSNDPGYSAIYVTSGLHRADNIFSRTYDCSEHYLITSHYQGDVLQRLVNQVLEQRFKGKRSIYPILHTIN